MPMYLKATPSLPSNDISISETETFNGTEPVGDADVQRDNELYLAEGATYIDVPVQCGPEVLKLDATLTWDYTHVGTGNGLFSGTHLLNSETDHPAIHHREHRELPSSVRSLCSRW